METKLEILQTLITCRAFAPTPSALALELGYKGKMGLYRLLKGEAGTNTVEEVWKRIRELYGLSEEELELSARVFAEADDWFKRLRAGMEVPEPLEAEELLGALVTDNYQDFSPEFCEKSAPVLLDMKEDEPKVFWGIVTLVFLRARGMVPYQDDIRKQGREVVAELNEWLADIYPERRDAHDVGINMVAMDLMETLWSVVDYCVMLFRAYTDPSIRSEVAGELRFFGWDEESYWLLPGCEYKPGATFWMLVQAPMQRLTGGFYLGIQLEAGKNMEEFSIKEVLGLMFHTKDGVGEFPLLQVFGGTLQPREWDFYLYKYDADRRMLYFSSEEVGKGRFALPDALQRLDRGYLAGKDEKVWARAIAVWQKQDEGRVCLEATKRISGIEFLDDTYRVKDVVMSREWLTLLVEEPAEDNCLVAYRIPIVAYDFFATINPTQEVLVVRYPGESSLCVMWTALFYVIPLDEFERSEKEVRKQVF